MTDKIRGVIAMLVGVFALYQGYKIYSAGRTDWHVWLEVAAGIFLIVIGIWRFQRKQVDPTAELLK